MDANLETGLDANREYKDTVFSLLFGNKEVLIPLSNTIFGTNYDQDTEVVISTIRKSLTKSRMNDLSYTLDKRLIVLIEHQSTINENMPYRMLQYIAELYKRLHEEEDDYRRQMFTLQRPKFIVLYNGTEEMQEDKRILRLSDMFPKYGLRNGSVDSELIDLELTVKMYNINRGRNEEMVKRCATLYEYSIFMDSIRQYQKKMPNLGDAIQKAVVECIDQNVLKTFLLKHKREVVNMLVSEWNMAVALKVEREEGEMVGRKKEKMENARAMRAEGIDVDTVSKITGLTVDDILRL